MIKGDDLHQIGVFAKPHGVKGEISIITDYELSGVAGDLFVVCNIDEIYVPFFVESFRQKSASNILVKLENLDSEDKVKFLSGKQAFIPSNLYSLHEEHPSHRHALTGYTIVGDHADVIGEVVDIDDSTPNILLKVSRQNDEILIPLSLISSIQHHQQTMTALLPDGFLELYNTTNETAK